MVQFSKFKVPQKPMNISFLWPYMGVCVLIRAGALIRSNMLSMFNKCLFVSSMINHKKWKHSFVPTTCIMLNFSHQNML